MVADRSGRTRGAARPTIRFLELAGIAHLDVPPAAEALIFGLGIFAAATLLTWASEVAETEISAGLALVALALIAVLPEYAVDLYFAWTAPDNPDNAHLAIANMTGGNRLLVGLAWPVIFLIFWLKTRRNEMPIVSGNSVGILFLWSPRSTASRSRSEATCRWSTPPSCSRSSRRTCSSRPERHRREHSVFVGPALAIASLPRTPRRAWIVGIFVYSALVIFAAAEPFAESLVETGKNAGIDEFVLVQWVAPLASESPEFILAGLIALRGRYDASMTILISSKVNQWTLLIGSLPLAYSISGGTLSPLDFDSRQSEEIFLTAAQSLFAVAILVSLSVNRFEAAALAGLFLTQFFFTNESVRIVYGFVYLILAFIVFIRDIPRIPTFARAVRQTIKDPGGVDDASIDLTASHPP